MKESPEDRRIQGSLVPSVQGSLSHVERSGRLPIDSTGTVALGSIGLRLPDLATDITGTLASFLDRR